MIKKIIAVSWLLLGSLPSLLAYGPLGHRTVAEIAQKHLSCKAKRHISKLLGNENLVLVSTYADDIKSDSKYDYTHTWHYVNMNKGVPYAESKKNPKGDIITAFHKCVAILKSKTSGVAEKQFALKMLVHLVGDAHQPFHVGREADRGGNDIKVQWFGRETNIHRVWDSDMLQSYGMSYSELAENMPKIKRKKRKEWQKGSIEEWIEDVRELTEIVYSDIQQGENLRYRYMYDHFETLRIHLHKGGIRLAGILNEIY